MKKKKVMAVVLTVAMTMGMLAGCGSATDSTNAPAAGDTPTDQTADTVEAEDSVEAAAAEDVSAEGGELTFLIDTDVSIAGFEAVALSGAGRGRSGR